MILRCHNHLIKKAIAAAITLSLLLQQGFFISEAFAQGSVSRTPSAQGGKEIAPIPASIQFGSALDGMSPIPPLAGEAVHEQEAFRPTGGPGPSVQPLTEAQEAPGSAAEPHAPAGRVVGHPGKAPSAHRVAAFLSSFAGQLTHLSPGVSTLSFFRKKFDQSDPATSFSDSVPLENLRIFVSRHDRPTVTREMTSLDGLLSEPGLVSSLNEEGTIRIIINNKNPRLGLRKADAPRIAEILQRHGVTARIEIENIPVDWKRHAKRKVEEKSGPIPSNGTWFTKRAFYWALAPLVVPFRELPFLARTFAASYTTPTLSEVIGGVISKGPPFAASVVLWLNMIGPTHPFLLSAAILLSLGVEGFHGFWLNTWNNFNNNLFKLCGGKYQVSLMWFYGQSWPALSRILSWRAVPNDPRRAPPWTLTYWKAMGAVSFIGTFFGVLGIRGLNTLHEIGRLSFNQRSAIQQARDFFMVMSGICIGSGSLVWGIGFFLTQQFLDFGIFYFSLRCRKRPVLHIADSTVMETKEFGDLYSSVFNPPNESPFKQALKAVLDLPLLWPVVLPVQLGLRLVRRRSGAGSSPI